jgi:hypothetical protein
VNDTSIEDDISGINGSADKKKRSKYTYTYTHSGDNKKGTLVFDSIESTAIDDDVAEITISASKKKKVNFIPIIIICHFYDDCNDCNNFYGIDAVD